ncbi:four-carbon acid sugar kinase family protein [Lacrimispora sp. JR3]|uniref:four-carbon acid sugar kinase family protein n=1 Tax=Lacrimispora sinapis TaxID=3111456 RepID=UPI003748D6E0
MVKMLIIADDITGALDTGIQFAKRGIRTQVFTEGKLDESDVKADTEVIVVDSESRPMSANESYQVVKNIADWAHKKGVGIIFKKTDSALRGNIGSELQAVADAVKDFPIYFLPGHPEIGRITKGGVHYISGDLLENSVFGKDPFEPVTRSYIPDIIRDQSDIPVICKSAEEPIADKSNSRSEIIVCDTETVKNIDDILDKLVKADGLQLIAGCAVLGERLAEKIPFDYGEVSSYEKTDGLYVACGSLNKITLRQLEYAEQNDSFIRKKLTMKQKFSAGYYETPEGKKFLEEMIDLCRTNQKVIVDSFDTEENIADFMADKGKELDNLRTLIPQAHGRIVKALAEEPIDLTFLLTGGDTLMGYLKLVGCRHIEPVCEIEPGLVVCKLLWEGHCQQIISKSGGFGTEDILCRIALKIIE